MNQFQIKVLLIDDQRIIGEAVRNMLAEQVSSHLVEHFGTKVYRTVIPRNVRLAEAPSHGMPVIKFDRTSKGAIAYLALAGEMLNRAA